MLLTHSMLTTYLAMLSIIYIIVNFKELDKKTILKLFKSAIIILLLTSFYWAPLLESKFSADYEVFNKDHMIRWDAMEELKPSVFELFVQHKDRMAYGLGIIVIIGTIIAIFTIKKLSNKKNYILFWVLGIISTIMALDIFPFEKLPYFFTMMQFSFRMLEFSSFFLVVVSSIALAKNLDKFNIYTVIFLTAISILLLLPSCFSIKYKTYYNENDLINGIKVTSKTGRVHAGCASFEYLPTKAFQNRKYTEDREDKPIVLNSENYTIENYNKNGTNCTFQIKSDESIEIELPYIYYIGYNVKYKGQEIKIYESENGFLTINIENPNGVIEVNYTGTNVMKMSYIVSLSTGIICIVYIIRKSFINTQK